VLIAALPHAAAARPPLPLGDFGPLANHGRLLQAGGDAHELNPAAVQAVVTRLQLAQRFAQLRAAHAAAGDDGRLPTAVLRKALLGTSLPDCVLGPRCALLTASRATSRVRVSGDILRLVDTDNDNRLNERDFFLLHFFIERKLAGHEVPKKMPEALTDPPTGTTTATPTSVDSATASTTKTASLAVAKTNSATTANTSKASSLKAVTAASLKPNSPRSGTETS